MRFELTTPRWIFMASIMLFTLLSVLSIAVLARFELVDDVTSCDPRWHCTEWTSCADGEQVRICADINDCKDEDEKPREVRRCKEDDAKLGLDDNQTSASADTSVAGKSADRINQSNTSATGFRPLAGMDSQEALKIAIGFAIFVMLVMVGYVVRTIFGAGSRSNMVRRMAIRKKKIVIRLKSAVWNLRHR